MSVGPAGEVRREHPDAEAAARRAEVEALISRPEYQAVEAATTEREFQDQVEH